MILYHTILYHTIPYHAIPYHTIQSISYHAISNDTIGYDATPHYTKPPNTYHTIPYYTILYTPYFMTSNHTSYPTPHPTLRHLSQAYLCPSVLSCISFPGSSSFSSCTSKVLLLSPFSTTPSSTL